MRSGVLIGVLLARIASANAPHGHYWLRLVEPAHAGLTADGKAVPSCGNKTKASWNRLRVFDVTYSSKQAPGKSPTETVFVDHEPWIFDGFTTGPHLAAAERPGTAGVWTSLAFGFDQHQRVEALVEIIVIRDGIGICGDVSYLAGWYSPPLPGSP